MDIKATLRRPRTWLIAVPALVLLVAVVGPFVYIHFIEGPAPAKLTFADVNTTTATAAASTSSTTTASPGGATLDGEWTVTDGSQAGYRIGEVLFGQDAEAVGRTTDVTGTLTLAGTSIPSATFSVDMTTVASDPPRAQRDSQFQGRIMETSTFPTATFELTSPITLDAIPADQEEVTVSVTGDFTIHGVTKSATFDLTARLDGTKLELNGSVPIVFADYGINDPSGGPATVKDHGEMEFLVVLTHA